MLSLQTQLARWPLILVGEDGHEPTKDSGAEDLAYYVIEEQHQRYHGTDKTVVNSGIARICTLTGDWVDADGQRMGRRPKPEHLKSGVCYSAAVPPCNCDEGVRELAPRCRCLGAPKCTAAQVWVLVDGNKDEMPKLRRAANVFQCANSQCGFRQEMGPTVYYFMNRGTTTYMKARGGSMIHYVAEAEHIHMLDDAETLARYITVYGEEPPLNKLRESDRSGLASEDRTNTGDARYGGECLSLLIQNNPFATQYSMGIGQLAQLKSDMQDSKPTNPYTMEHELSFTAYQLLLWNCLGLNVQNIHSTEMLKNNPDIMEAETALEHLFMEQHYDGHRHEWTPNEVMSRMEELLALHAPLVLAGVKRRGNFDIHGAAEIIDYVVNVTDAVVIEHLQFCMAFASHAVMTNDKWEERCNNRYIDMSELKWLILFAISRTRGTRNAILRRTRFNDAEDADRLLDLCKPALEELLNFQMQAKEKDPDPIKGVITVEAVEFILRRRLTEDVWAEIEMCGGLEKHHRVWEKHLCRKTVVAAVGQTYRTTQNFILDGYNRLVDTNRDWIPLGSVGYADRLPGPIIAVTTVSSGCGDYKPNIDMLMAKVQAQRYKVPISRYSMRHHSLFTGTGLLTSDEIEKRKRIDQQIKQRMRGFRDNTSDELKCLKYLTWIRLMSPCMRQ